VIAVRLTSDQPEADVGIVNERAFSDSSKPGMAEPLEISEQTEI
jgi:hypothetical protein